MPLQSCQKEGEAGTKYGSSGTCYTGSGAKEKAQKQAAAMYASGYQGDRQMKMDMAMEQGADMVGRKRQEMNDACGMKHNRM